MGYDVIGDIHGELEKLEALLAKLGYRVSNGAWRHPAGRQVAFLGDLIDRGTGQLGVLRIARAMCEDGSAVAVMGNHEFNAIGFATPGGEGGFLRPRTPKNVAQHAAFLAAVGLDSPLHKEWIDWFKTLPLALDLGGIRLAHAWWDDESVRLIDPVYRDGAQARMSDDFLFASYRPGPLKEARKVLTCGVEWDLPEGVLIYDKAGHPHGEARLAVWRHWAKRLPEIALVPKSGVGCVPDIEIPADVKLVDVAGTPILIGHHWFAGEPGIETPRLACLDWSAAAGGPLVAYRWEGEPELTDTNLFWVGPAEIPLAREQAMA